MGLPTLFYFIWHPGLFRGEARIPKRSYLLFVAVVALSVVAFLKAWDFGLEYQGARYMYVVAAVNMAWAVGLAAAFARAWKAAPSFKFSVVLHWMLFAWLAWYAFPWMGDLP